MLSDIVSGPAAVAVWPADEFVERAVSKAPHQEAMRPRFTQRIRPQQNANWSGTFF